VTDHAKVRRFWTNEQAADELNVSVVQVRPLVKPRELRTLSIGGSCCGAADLTEKSRLPRPTGTQQNA
jgi:hypothetical protein